MAVAGDDGDDARVGVERPQRRRAAVGVLERVVGEDDDLARPARAQLGAQPRDLGRR